MKCAKCQGSLEPITRGGAFQFNMCRACRIPYNEFGKPVVELGTLNTSFNPLKLARDAVPGTGGVAKTALEIQFIISLQEAYTAGLKDGVLLAYSQDFKPGEPV